MSLNVPPVTSTLNLDGLDLAHLATLPYPQRLAALLAANPEADRTGILATGRCITCGAPMQRRVNAARTDSFWEMADGADTVFEPESRWDHLDRLLADGDVAAYSRWKAHYDLGGIHPAGHVHQPRH